MGAVPIFADSAAVVVPCALHVFRVERDDRVGGSDKE